jgi:hypothetical protein
MPGRFLSPGTEPKKFKKTYSHENINDETENRLVPSLRVWKVAPSKGNPNHGVRNEMRNNRAHLSYGWASAALRSASQVFY